MSNLIDSSQANLKKIFRTAFVGVNPGDQVLIKGYLRVLLRLEADLNWVAASETQVDLFIINQEFQNAPSVVKRLAGLVGGAVLYVRRDEDQAGGLTGDTLNLPLKRLTELDDWLTRHVAVLNSGLETTYSDSNSSGVSQHNSNDRLTPAAPADADRPPSRQKRSSVDTAAQALNEARPPIFDSTTINSSKDYAGVIDVIKQLQSQPEGLFAITTNGAKRAIVEPSLGRAWQVAPIAEVSSVLNWQLRPYQGLRPELYEAQDLRQCLWEWAWEKPEALMALVSDHQRYQLRYWIKPNNCQDRRDLLRIFTALEREPQTIAQLAAVTQCSVITVKKAVAGLLLTGNLTAPSYESISVDTNTLIQPKLTAGDPPERSRACDQRLAEARQDEVSSPVAAVSSPTESSVLDASKPDQTSDAGLSPLDRVLARRNSNQSLSTIGSGPRSTASIASKLVPKTTSGAAANSGESQGQKRGFLAKLRLKLGLA